tara:strand:- start:199 stop:423 length:225 start_codon:yes stop_codon:yes gene_type:complete
MEEAEEVAEGEVRMHRVTPRILLAVVAQRTKAIAAAPHCILKASAPVAVGVVPVEVEQMVKLMEEMALREWIQP